MEEKNPRKPKITWSFQIWPWFARGMVQEPGSSVVDLRGGEGPGGDADSPGPGCIPHPSCVWMLLVPPCAQRCALLMCHAVHWSMSVNKPEQMFPNLRKRQ